MLPLQVIVGIHFLIDGQCGPHGKEYSNGRIEAPFLSTGSIYAALTFLHLDSKTIQNQPWTIHKDGGYERS